MKRIHKIACAIIMALLFIITTYATPIQNTVAISSAATITISSKVATLEQGSTKTLKIDGTKRTVTWSTSKKSVATVSSTGKVTAKAIGDATITASVSGRKLTCKITVKEPIIISHTSYTLSIGKTKTLKISGTTKSCSWTSNKNSVATVSSKGKITAMSTGKATITATVDGKKLTCIVKVREGNPYLSKVPFEAKEVKFGNSSIVVPADWYVETDESYEDMSFAFLAQDDTYGEPNISFTVVDTGAPAPGYEDAKKEFINYFTEDDLRSAYTEIYKDIEVNINNFSQSDYVASFGDVFKTEYLIEFGGTSIKEEIYAFYIDEKYVEVTMTYSNDDNFKNILKYVLDSFMLK